MPIAVTEDHESLRQAAQRWAQTHCPPSVPRAVAEAPAVAELPPVWEKLVAQGWLGLHVPESEGGQGFTLAEVAVVVLEELGHALLPGPFLPTVVVSAVLARHPGDGTGPLLAGLADGSITAVVALGAEPLPPAPTDGQGAEGAVAAEGSEAAEATEGPDAVRLSGTVRPVLGLGSARLVLVPLEQGDREVRWIVVDRERWGDAVDVEPLAALHGTRTVGSLVIGGDGIVIPAVDQVWASDEEVLGSRVDPCGGGERGDRALGASKTASDYAKVRVQFGRPIGQFQAVKHALPRHAGRGRAACRGGLDAAAAWSESVRGRARARGSARPGRRPQRPHRRRDRSRPPPTARSSASRSSAASASPGSTTRTFYLKRAMANLQLAAGGDVGGLEHDVASLAVAGARRDLAADLPSEAESVREEIRAVVAEVAAAGAADPDARRCRPGGADHAALAAAVGPWRLTP